MNNRGYINLNDKKTVATEEGFFFSGILVLSECCLCCIQGTGGHLSCS